MTLDESGLLAEIDRLRADYSGGDQEAQALAWAAVYRRCREYGMPVFYKETGRESVLAYISTLVAKDVGLRAALAEAVKLLEPFADIGIPDNWPSNCVLTWNENSRAGVSVGRYASISYLSSNVDPMTAPKIADYRSAAAFVAKHKVPPEGTP